MKCEKCGQQLPEGAGFCPVCGTQVAHDPSDENRPVHHSQVVEKKPKTSATTYIILAMAGLALLAIIAALVVHFTGALTDAPEPRGLESNVLDAPESVGPDSGLLDAPEANRPEVPKVPLATKPKPTQDMIDYLNHVEEIEKKRHELLADTSTAYSLMATDQADTLIGMFDIAMDPNADMEDIDPLKKTREELVRQYENWRKLLARYDSKTAPQPLAAFSGAYREVIFEEAKAIGKVAVSMQELDMTSKTDMTGVLKSLQSMKSDPNLQSSLDKTVEKADDRLDQVVARYDMEKTFEVKKEKKSGGSILDF